MPRYEPSHPSAKRPPVIPLKLSDVRETDEYEAEANRIKDMYLDKPYKMKLGNVGHAKSLREHILSMSLFPNVYNAKTLGHEIGPN